MTDVSDFLMHYGVKGMKWGVKKSKDGGAVVKAKFKPVYTEADRTNARFIAKQGKRAGNKGAVDGTGSSVRRVSKLSGPERALSRFILTKPFYGIAGAINNKIRNPTVKIKAKMDKEAYESYVSGKNFSADFVGKHGSVKVTGSKKESVFDLFDSDGRDMGRVNAGSRAVRFRKQATMVNAPKRVITD